MSLPFLLYCSLLKKSQYKHLRDLVNVNPGADYYPYGTNAPSEAALDFAQAAHEAVKLAWRVVVKTREYIKLKEAGSI